MKIESYKSIIFLIYIIGFSSGVIFTVSPMSIHQTAYEGGSNPSPVQIHLSLSGVSGRTNWRATSSASWLDLSSSSGSILTSATTTASFDISKLSAGTKTTTITITIPNESLTKRVSVTLVVYSANCDERETCGDCVTDTEECGWCADSQNVTIGTCTSSKGTCNTWFQSKCPIICSNKCIHGTCNYASGKCKCDSNYFTANCSVYCSAAQNCSSRGSCMSDGTCHCDDEYYGESCQYMYCPNSCSGNGNCNNMTGICSCFENYYTDDCSVFCNSTTCNNRGTCDFDGSCNCTTNYYGAHCSTFCDPSSNCTNHGTCTSYGACACDPHYYLSNCSVYCDGCSPHGYCNGYGQCTCYEPYYSENCTLMHCPGYNATADLACTGNGNCNATDGICECDAGWFTESCGKYCDDQETCSGHGSCDSNGDCVCEAGYEGSGCSEEEKKSGSEVIIIGVSVAAGVVVVVAGIAFFFKWRSRRGYTSLD